MNELLALADEDPDEAVRQATELLNKDPDSVLALHVIGLVYLKAERSGAAAAFLKRIVDLRPKQPTAWINYGMALAGCHRHDDAIKVFRDAWKLENSSAAAANIAMCHLNMQEWQKAIEWANKAIAKNKDSASARTTLGMAKLALGDYSGWTDSKFSIGGRFRKQIQFQDEPMWEGQQVDALVVYGEQGLGDEIMYASCIRDAKERCNTLIIECDARLESLYKQSFPFAHVYGTRRQDGVEWPAKYKIDASVPVGRLPEFFRTSKESFPGTPYLVADKERSIQWRALFNSWGSKPKIGLAWSGGSKHNYPDARAMGLEAFRPLIESVDADWISLQYKDPTQEIEETGLPVRHFARATLTNDYNDTAGLVAELDMVIGVHTSVHHLAGGLGVRSIVLVPTRTIWVYGSDFPWYKSAKLFRQNKGEDWKDTVRRLHDSGICRL